MTSTFATGATATGTAAAAAVAPRPIHGPPPPLYHNPSWTLLSQGAEARLWRVPSFLSVSVGGGTDSADDAAVQTVVCKERFPKSYRHPSLDASITKSRTRAEARCLVRCRRGGVPCPAVLGVDVGGSGGARKANHNGDGGAEGDGAPARESSCLFLEFVGGCTVREYFDSRSSDGGTGVGGEEFSEPERKRARCGDGEDSKGLDRDVRRPFGTAMSPRKTTMIEDDAIHVACAIGSLVASMHNVNVVHGDLTTSNIMLRNPPPGVSSASPTGRSNTDESGDSDGKPSAPTDWEPQLVLIDLGLAGTAGSKGVSHEEKAVDLYVLERAFVSTHPGSDDLVAEIIRAYKRKCKTSDSVLQRLSQVRLRGRKRECFG